jgi:hypothetical protein
MKVPVYLIVKSKLSPVLLTLKKENVYNAAKIALIALMQHSATRKSANGNLVLVE